MSHRQNVEENLKRFAEGIGLGELTLNEHGACGLCFDDSLIVNMEYLEEDEALVFVSSVSPVETHLQESDKLELLDKVMFINLQHHSMQGAYMALNHDKSEILLIRSMTAGIDYGAFETILEKFVNTLEWVTAEVTGEGGNPSNPVAVEQKQQQQQNPPSSPPGDMGMMV